MRIKTKFVTVALRCDFLLPLIFILFLTCPAFSKNIAVIPFQNITGDKEKNWIGAGFSETLTTKLVKVSEITVLERENLSKILEEIKFQYTGAVDEKTAVEKGKLYGAEVIVFGSFQVVGEKLKITARFVDVQTRKIIDTAEADGNISDIFKLQDEIAFSLLDSLKIVLGEKEKEEIKINPTEDLTAYQWFSKGYEASTLKLYDKAIEYYTKVIQMNKYAAWAYNNRGLAYYKKELYDEAIEDYTKAIQINMEDAKPHIKSGNFDITTAVPVMDTDAEAYYNRGLGYHKKNLYDEAIKDYTKAIKLNPKHADAYYVRGIAYNIKRLYDEAMEDYTKAIQINTKYVKAYYNRGLAYYKKGLKKLCISDWKKAADLGSEEARQNLKEFFNIDY